MSNAKLRQRIAFEAARLMYQREEKEYFRAKLKAARRICRGDAKPSDLPSNAEIREQIQGFARLLEGEQRMQHLREMRFAALRMMRLLEVFRPRLIGSVLTGHIRDGSDIDLHVFSNSLEAVASTLDEAGLHYDLERKQVRKHGEEQVFRHVHIYDHFRYELTVYSEELVSYAFKSSITGKAIEKVSLPELEKFLAAEYPDAGPVREAAEMEARPDRFLYFSALLAPLERVKQSPIHHPEGDVLYHSLQVFDLARDESPYDEEFLLAALLHDVGKGIDKGDHVAAGLEALGDFITERTQWFIAHHMEAHALADGTIGARARKRLESHPDFDDLMSLQKCDKRGRARGVQTSTLEEALDALRELARLCGE